MSSHPLNLTLRFLLEITSLISAGVWGYNQADSWVRFLLAATIPVFMAVLWGVFAVPDDPSRSGKTVIPTSGVMRLFLELGFFGFATWALIDLNYSFYGYALGIVTIVHYLVSYDRIAWLISK